MRIFDVGRPVLFLCMAIHGFGVTALGVTQYIFTPLDQPGTASSINSMGQVVGRRYIWTPGSPNSPNGTFNFVPIPSEIGLSGLVDVNDYGQVLGRVSVMDANFQVFTRAMVWTPSTPNGTVFSTMMLDPITGFAELRPSAINNQGQIVGQLQNDSPGPTAPFLWSPAGPNLQTGSMVVLQHPDAGIVHGEASDINAQGQVTGRAFLPVGATVLQRTFLWTPQEPNGNVGSMVGLPSDFAMQIGINGSGQVSGSRFHGGAIIASKWTPREPSYVHESLTNLSLAGSQGFGINSQGDVVGFGPPSDPTKGSAAFIWTAGEGMIDLNTLLSNPLEGWWLRSANAINDFGQIVGRADYDPDGDGPAVASLRGFLLTPVPEPVMAGPAIGLILLWPSRGGRRLVSRRAAWNN